MAVGIPRVFQSAVVPVPYPGATDSRAQHAASRQQ
jgi:hypothetical protein